MEMDIVPNELWIQIFESIQNPADLARIMATCRSWNALAIRIFCRCIIWNDPRTFSRNIPFWENNTALLHLPISLTVGFSRIRSESTYLGNAAIVALDGTWTRPEVAALGGLQDGHNQGDYVPYFPVSPQKIEFFAGEPLYEALLHRIPTFTQLKELVFHNTLIPEEFHVVVHNLPQLRQLHIRDCKVQRRSNDAPQPTFPDHASLPITELTLSGITVSGTSSRNDLHFVPPLLLATAHNLRTLRVEWTPSAAIFFARHANPYHTLTYSLPAHIERLEVLMLAEKLWPHSDAEAGLTFIDPLREFLSGAPSIQHLSICDYIPRLNLPVQTLPNLRSYSGPLCAAIAVAGARPLESVDILDGGKKLEELTGRLAKLAESQSTLQTLCISIQRWDDEILYAICSLFRDLETLQIAYKLGGPTEHILLSLGSQFLDRIPNIHTVRIFKLEKPEDVRTPPIDFGADFDFDVSWRGSESSEEEVEFREELTDEAVEELRELIFAWHRYCPKLREVQLLDGFVWRRAFNGDSWAKRRFEIVDGVRNFAI